jgi:hypothetical protein
VGVRADFMGRARVRLRIKRMNEKVACNFVKSLWVAYSANEGYYRPA